MVRWLILILLFVAPIFAADLTPSTNVYMLRASGTRDAEITIRTLVERYDLFSHLGSESIYFYDSLFDAAEVYKPTFGGGFYQSLHELNLVNYDYDDSVSYDTRMLDSAANIYYILMVHYCDSVKAVLVAADDPDSVIYDVESLVVHIADTSIAITDNFGTVVNYEKGDTLEHKRKRLWYQYHNADAISPFYYAGYTWLAAGMNTACYEASAYAMGRILFDTMIVRTVFGLADVGPFTYVYMDNMYKDGSSNPPEAILGSYWDITFEYWWEDSYTLYVSNCPMDTQYWYNDAYTLNVSNCPSNLEENCDSVVEWRFNTANCDSLRRHSFGGPTVGAGNLDLFEKTNIMDNAVANEYFLENQAHLSAFVHRYLDSLCDADGHQRVRLAGNANLSNFNDILAVADSAGGVHLEGPMGIPVRPGAWRTCYHTADSINLLRKNSWCVWYVPWYASVSKVNYDTNRAASAFYAFYMTVQDTNHYAMLTHFKKNREWFPIYEYDFSRPDDDTASRVQTWNELQTYTKQNFAEARFYNDSQYCIVFRTTPQSGDFDMNSCDEINLAFDANYTWDSIDIYGAIHGVGDSLFNICEGQGLYLVQAGESPPQISQVKPVSGYTDSTDTVGFTVIDDFAIRDVLTYLWSPDSVIGVNDSIDLLDFTFSTDPTDYTPEIEYIFIDSGDWSLIIEVSDDSGNTRPDSSQFLIDVQYVDEPDPPLTKLQKVVARKVIK